MKHEAQEEEKEVIYIKEEPEEEQEVMATLLLDCHEQQGHQPESEVTLQLWGTIFKNISYICVHCNFYLI